jgi:hypothetical protein
MRQFLMWLSPAGAAARGMPNDCTSHFAALSLGVTFNMGFTTPLVFSLLLLGLAHGLAASVPEQLMEEAKQHHCGDDCREVGIATASLNVRLHGTGAHRHLLYRLTVHCTQQLSGDRRDSDPAAASLPPPASCPQVAVLQPLPPAVFADIYQLDNAAALGLGPPVRLFGQVDVESIERYAQPTVLAVYSSNHSAAPGQVRVRLIQGLSARPTRLLVRIVP